MKVVEVAAREEYRIFLRFENGVAGEVDLSTLAGRGVFAAWLQPGVFEQVSVTRDGAVEWPGDLDLCPDDLYLRLTGLSPDGHGVWSSNGQLCTKRN